MIYLFGKGGGGGGFLFFSDLFLIDASGEKILQYLIFIQS